MRLSEEELDRALILWENRDIHSRQIREHIADLRQSERDLLAALEGLLATVQRSKAGTALGYGKDFHAAVEAARTAIARAHREDGTARGEGEK